jgi:hypothetical protein
LRGDLRGASGLDAVMVGWPVLIRIVYLLVRQILGLAVLALCGDMAKDAELLVLRHENAVLRRHGRFMRQRAAATHSSAPIAPRRDRGRSPRQPPQARLRRRVRPAMAWVEMPPIAGMPKRTNGLIRIDDSGSS